MKISIDESIDVEFDPWSLKEAQAHLEEVKRKYKDHHTGKPDAGRFDTVMNGIFTLLLFAQIEKNKPGCIQRLMDQAGKLAEAMTPPKETSAEK